MKRITDVTRQDIFDTIRNGVWILYDEPQYDYAEGNYVDGYTVKISDTGRLSEIDFLSRLYDLDHMPSTDSRYSNASGDIWQHTVNNNDWEDYWYLTDRRFHLSNGNDDESMSLSYERTREKGTTTKGRKEGGVGEKRGQRDEKMEAGTANKPRDENRLKKEKNEAEKVVQGGAAGGIKKVGRGSKPGV